MIIEKTCNTSRDKKIIFIYTVLTLLISWVLEYFYVFQNKAFSFVLLHVSFFPLMMVPGLLALLFLLIIPGYRVRDIGFRLGGWNHLLIGLFYPFFVVGIVAGLGMLLGFASYAPQIPSTSSYLLHSLMKIPLVLIIALPTHLGEEVGWRGFLLQKSLKFGRIRAVAISSGVWVLYHTIVALKPSEGIGLLWRFGFLTNIFAAGFVFAWLYIRSGSIWPVYLMHVVWNFVNPLILGNVYSNQNSPIFKADVRIVNGEGLIGCCVNVIVAGIILWLWLGQKNNMKTVSESES